jgi:hypothetical protein
MVRTRRTGIVVAAAIFIVVVGAAFITEGLGLAVIAAIGFAVLAALTIPLLAMFEEEHDLPAERASRVSRYPRAR